MNVIEESPFTGTKTIIETCPGLLATKNVKGSGLPIHCAISRCGNEELVPMMASVGNQYAVGGIEARGGLLVEDKDYCANVLQIVA